MRVRWWKEGSAAIDENVEFDDDDEDEDVEFDVEFEFEEFTIDVDDDERIGDEASEMDNGSLIEDDR